MIASVAASALVAAAFPAVAGTRPAPPVVMGLTVGNGVDITTDSTPLASWWATDPTTYDLETATADSFADALGGWSRIVTDGAGSGRYRLAVGGGRVLCVRVRPHTATDDLPWTTDCAVRPRADAAFRIVGPHATVSAPGSPSPATRLLRGGALEVSGLRSGMRVSAVYLGSDFWASYDDARWEDPGGIEQKVGFGRDGGIPEMEFLIDQPGTGRFFADGGPTTRPIRGIAVLPEWFPFYDQSSFQNTDATLLTPMPPMVLPTVRQITWNGQVRLGWVPSQWSNVATELQIAEGSSLGTRPDWHPRALPPFASSLRLLIREGHTLCARIRSVREDGVSSGWSRTACVTRPFGDEHVSLPGRFHEVEEPSAPDGRARRLGTGARLRVRGIPGGSRFGYIFREEPTVDHSPRPDPALLINGQPRSPTGWISADKGPTLPSGWEVKVTRDGSVGVLRLDSTNAGLYSHPAAGLFVIPRWAA